MAEITPLLVDQFSLNSRPMADGGFESPIVTDYQNTPTGTAWSFIGTTGVAHNGGTYTNHNPPAPGGSQVAFVKGHGSLWQNVSLPGGNYELTFYTAQRASGNGSGQRM